MARTKDGYTLVICSPTADFVESVRAHSDRANESMSAFGRRMIARGIQASIEDGTIYAPPPRKSSK